MEYIYGIFVGILIFAPTAYSLLKAKEIPNNIKEIKRFDEHSVSPVIAESLIDGKINLDKLILTTLVELVVKGKISRQNGVFKLESIDDLDEYEKEVVFLLFDEVGDETSFKQINDNLKENDCFESKISHLKYEIRRQLREDGFFDSKVKSRLNVVKAFAIMNIINLVFFLLSVCMKSIPFTAIITGNLAGLLVIGFLRNNIYQVIDELFSFRNVGRIILWIFFICLISILSYLTLNIYFLLFGILEIVLILNSLNYSTLDTYTEKGIISLHNILAYKNYLMSNEVDVKDVDNDNYTMDLAYAIAFNMKTALNDKIENADIKINFKG